MQYSFDPQPYIASGNAVCVVDGIHNGTKKDAVKREFRVRDGANFTCKLQKVE